MSDSPERDPEPNGVPEESVACPSLNADKLRELPAEQRELYLLTFSTDLANLTSSVTSEQINVVQIKVKKQLLRLIALTDPFPTKVVRQNIGRAFSDIFTKGDRKPLFETINALIEYLVASGKEAKPINNKHAATYALGAIFGAAGDSAISLSSLACSSLNRQLKAGQTHAGLRASVYNALSQLFRTVAGSVDEGVARDVWSSARKTIVNDKAVLAQAAAAKCLKTLVKSTPYFDNANDFESLRTSLLKLFEASTAHNRHAAASCLAAVFLKGFTEDASKPQPKRKPKKAQSKQAKTPIDDEDEERIVSPEPVSEKKAATKLSFTLSDILLHLSGLYTRTNISNKSRASVISCYRSFLRGLNQSIVETQYELIAKNLLVEIMNSPLVSTNRYRLLLTRRYIAILLEDLVGGQILGEAGQIRAAKTLINSIIKNYPQVVKETPEPSKYTLTGAISALASLIKSLGAAANSFSELCREGLVQVLQHPSYTVQITTSYCLREFGLACPLQILGCIEACFKNAKRELDALGSPQQSPRRCVGYSNGLAALVSTTPLRQLNGSVEVNSRVFKLATELLKSSRESELRVSGAQIQVAWILIGGLMTLGPNFVKIHLPQLLVLWRNALPKPNTVPKSSQRSLLELSFLSHVRECALGSMLAFLQFNEKLLTTDVSKRLMTMLENTIAFSESLPQRKSSDDIQQRLFPALQLQDLDLMISRRVLQIYTKLVTLSPAGASEALLQSNLLTLTIGSFADPENYSPLSLSSSIANAAGSFESIWEVGDNVGFGISGLVQGFSIEPILGETEKQSTSFLFDRRGQKHQIDQLLLTPVLGAKEHDSLSLYSVKDNGMSSRPHSPPTEVVNSAIVLFAVALPLQNPRIQESILEQLATFLSSPHLQRDAGRRAALSVNVALALLTSLKVSLKETDANSGDFKNAAVERVLLEMLRRFVRDNDHFMRNIGCEALARLCSKSGNALTNAEIKQLVELIVQNREPCVRAGCALALGSIHSRIGGMAAGLHLKTIHGILMSLSSDPHPTVHFWALEGLSKVAESAGLTFSGFVPSTLGMLGQLYISDAHNEETAGTTNSNLELDCPTSFVLGRCLDSLINVLGPDLQDTAKARDMIINLVKQFQKNQKSPAFIESLRCLEHLSLYASGYIEVKEYISRLETDFKSSHIDLRDVAVDGLCNLVKRNAASVIHMTSANFNEELWMALDQCPFHDGIRNIIKTWLEQTGLEETEQWLQKLQNVLTKTKPRRHASNLHNKDQRSRGMPDLQDEEVAGFAADVNAGKEETSDGTQSGQELLRWQVRTFALECLNSLLRMVERQINGEDLSAAQAVLQRRIADVIRIAFSASTSSVIELRVWGLLTIDRVLKIFGKTPDPEFTEAPLLEQYQAQISSALTPAFASDSSPELASAAVKVCASFIATGIVTDVDRMGRILKLLVSALDSFSDKSNPALIGDLRNLSSNAKVMLRMAVYSAWAELQIASLEQPYLVEVVKPNIAKLTPLWLESLREFAKLRFEPDISMNNGPPSASDSPDDVYSALNRQTLLGFYQSTWLELVDAIASLIEQDSELVFDALDGKISNALANGMRKDHDINYRDEPVAFFFVLYGITFEALAIQSSGDANSEDGGQTLEILQALKKLLHPSVSGQAIYQEVIFSETMDLLNRLVLTENLEVQAVIVEIARNLCLSHPSARRDQSESSDTLTEDIEQLFELTRIINLVLIGLLPDLSSSSNVKPLAISTPLIQSSLSALVSVSQIFPSIIKTDLHACLFHIFTNILSSLRLQETILPLTLPILKRFLSTLSDQPHRQTKTQLRAALSRLLRILQVAQRRESPLSLSCVKNSLFTITLFLTTASSLLTPNEPMLTSFMDELLDDLTDRSVATVAAGCIRSILLAPLGSNSNDPSPSLRAQLIYLLPRLLAFVTTTDTADPVNARGLVVSALTVFAISSPSLSSAAQKERFLAALVPALLIRAQAEIGDGAVVSETAARLLEIAKADGVFFKRIVAGLPVTERGTLEKVLTAAGQRDRGAGGAKGMGRGETEDDGDEKPSIALKMNFGGLSA